MQEGRVEFCYRRLRPLAVLVGVWMTKLLSSSSPSVATSADPDPADLAPFLRTSQALLRSNPHPATPIDNAELLHYNLLWDSWPIALWINLLWSDLIRDTCCRISTMASHLIISSRMVHHRITSRRIANYTLQDGPERLRPLISN